MAITRIITVKGRRHIMLSKLSARPQSAHARRSGDRACSLMRIWIWGLPRLLPIEEFRCSRSAHGAVMLWCWRERYDNINSGQSSIVMRRLTDSTSLKPPEVNKYVAAFRCMYCTVLYAHLNSVPHMMWIHTQCIITCSCMEFLPGWLYPPPGFIPCMITTACSYLCACTTD